LNKGLDLLAIERHAWLDRGYRVYLLQVLGYA